MSDAEQDQEVVDDGSPSQVPSKKITNLEPTSPKQTSVAANQAQEMIRTGEQFSARGSLKDTKENWLASQNPIKRQNDIDSDGNQAFVGDTGFGGTKNGFYLPEHGWPENEKGIGYFAKVLPEVFLKVTDSQEIGESMVTDLIHRFEALIYSQEFIANETKPYILNDCFINLASRALLPLDLQHDTQPILNDEDVQEFWTYPFEPPLVPHDFQITQFAKVIRPGQNGSTLDFGDGSMELRPPSLVLNESNSRIENLNDYSMLSPISLQFTEENRPTLGQLLKQLKELKEIKEKQILLKTKSTKNTVRKRKQKEASEQSASLLLVNRMKQNLRNKVLKEDKPHTLPIPEQPKKELTREENLLEKDIDWQRARLSRERKRKLEVLVQLEKEEEIKRQREPFQFDNEAGNIVTTRSDGEPFIVQKPNVEKLPSLEVYSKAKYKRGKVLSNKQVKWKKEYEEAQKAKQDEEDQKKQLEAEKQKQKSPVKKEEKKGNEDAKKEEHCGSLFKRMKAADGVLIKEEGKTKTGAKYEEQEELSHLMTRESYKELMKSQQSISVTDRQREDHSKAIFDDFNLQPIEEVSHEIDDSANQILHSLGDKSLQSRRLSLIEESRIYRTLNQDQMHELLIRNREMEGVPNKQSQVFLSKEDYFEEIDMTKLVPKLPKYMNRKMRNKFMNSSRYSLPPIRSRSGNQSQVDQPIAEIDYEDEDQEETMHLHTSRVVRKFPPFPMQDDGSEARQRLDRFNRRIVENGDAGSKKEIRSKSINFEGEGEKQGNMTQRSLPKAKKSFPLLKVSKVMQYKKRAEDLIERGAKDPALEQLPDAYKLPISPRMKRLITQDKFVDRILQQTNATQMLVGAIKKKKRNPFAGNLTQR